MGPSVLLIEFPFQQNLKTHINAAPKSAKSRFQNVSVSIYISQEKKVITKRCPESFQILNGIKTDKKNCYLCLYVAKVMRQWQHCEEKVNRSPPQVCWVYVHLEFGQFPDQSKVNIWDAEIQNVIWYKDVYLSMWIEN